VASYPGTPNQTQEIARAVSGFVPVLVFAFLLAKFRGTLVQIRPNAVKSIIDVSPIKDILIVYVSCREKKPFPVWKTNISTFHAP
jgi:hypothetical protein